jgi:hypothetical protein
VNSYSYTPEYNWTEGDTLTVYFQIVDANLDTSNQGFNPPGRRYIPASGSTMTVSLENIDDAKVLSKSATNPFASDLSIWSFNVISTDAIRGAPQMRITLSEGGTITRGLLKTSIRIAPNQNLE